MESDEIRSQIPDVRNRRVIVFQAPVGVSKQASRLFVFLSRMVDTQSSVRRRCLGLVSCEYTIIAGASLLPFEDS